INTDNPGLFALDLTHELEVARDEIGFTEGDLRAATRNALEASFLPEDVKAEALAGPFAWVR
ncbi:MAG: adenosine deaminase, partial [Actinomycetota bacterium]